MDRQGIFIVGPLVFLSCAAHFPVQKTRDTPAWSTQQAIASG
jgi:hypothetical protein